jgi:Leu/Phe-tRNA-protein transferase
MDQETKEQAFTPSQFSTWSIELNSNNTRTQVVSNCSHEADGSPTTEINAISQKIYKNYHI